MASVLIITTILNIVVSVVVSSEKQSSQFSPNKPLVQNDKKEVDRRTDTDSWGNQVKLDQLKSDKHENPSSLDRKKRQILFLVNRRPAPDALLRIPKSTQNPFIRETNVDEYDIGGPDDIEHIPQASDSGSHVTSHQQVEEVFKNAKQMAGSESENSITTRDITSLENLLCARNLFKWPINFLQGNPYSVQNKNNIKLSINKNEGNILKFMLYRFNSMPYKSPNIQDFAKRRVKRRVNKTLKRKKAKKRKQKGRRVERKRLRMLTHARRVRKQQKSKQARLQRHYARMNMTTTLIPGHSSGNCSKNQTQIQNKKSTETSHSSSIDDETEYESDEEYYDDSDDGSEDDEESDDTDESSDSASYGNDSSDYDEYASDAESIDYKNVNKDLGKSSNDRKIKRESMRVKVT